MKNSKNYFTTGEFAKICGVKKQTLFHYDDIGIFSSPPSPMNMATGIIPTPRSKPFLC